MRTDDMAKPVFLILGGSRGIGAAVARLAGRQDCEVVLTYAEHPDRAEAVAKEIKAAGGSGRALKADASQLGDIRALFEEVDRIGPLSAMVFSSGITGAASTLIDASPATIARVLDVNLLGAILCGREAVRRMSTAMGGAGGSIVFVSSRASAYGAAGEFVWYAASKGGLDSFAIGLAREVATQGIRVNLVSPGPIDTEMHRPGRLEQGASRTPMQRAGTPIETAEAVMFLVSDAASYITGANLAVSGGA
jgi:NAD(P)-dependent dehydrogenase (short-subunit alcohol dehydrogenase family)